MIHHALIRSFKLRMTSVLFFRARYCPILLATTSNKISPAKIHQNLMGAWVITVEMKLSNLLAPDTGVSPLLFQWAPRQ